MRVAVRLFAGLRERAGGGRREVELAPGARVADVWPALGLGEDEPQGLLYAVNRAYVERGSELADGDEVALIPPVSGGTDDVRVTAVPLSLDVAVRAAARDEAGAIATFIGTVRVRSRERTVHHLEYEAYEDMAVELLERLAADLRGRHGLSGIAIHHRTGRVEIGEASVVIAAAAPHRAEAFAACREAIETLKTSIPLWKKEVYEGGEEWIGRGS
jgi:molybdopterin synthase catalytic subunit